MSRALNIDAIQAHVVSTCAKLGVAISAIETLQSGGTRVVLNNAADTATINASYGNKVIAGPVKRTPTRLSHW